MTPEKQMSIDLHPRNVMAEILRLRMRKEKHIQKRKKPADRIVTIWGETKNVRQWSLDRRCAVSYEVLRNRIASGMDPEKCMTLPPIKGGQNLALAQVYEAWGEKKILSEWAKDPRCVVSLAVLKSRRQFLKDKYASVEDMLTRPLQRKHA